MISAFFQENDQKQDQLDEHGISKSLRDAINFKYEILEQVEKGSYGCIKKGICRQTGR